MNELFAKIVSFHDACIIKLSYIRKLPNGQYRVFSEKGRNMGTYDSKEKAKDRLRAIEYFKHQKADDQNNNEDKKEIDLTDIDDFVYSAVVRKLKQKTSQENLFKFLDLFKKEFDKAIKKKIHKPEKISLQNSLIKFNKICPIKLPKKMIKNAAISELGAPELVGKYLADIIRFNLNRISVENRQKAINNVKNKILHLNENEIGNKNMPAGSAIGSAVTFTKHILFNHDPHYVRQVLNNIVRNL